MVQSPPAPGDLVRVRGRLWQVHGVRAFDACTALQLEQLGRPGRDRRITLLAPFDRPELLSRTPALRPASRRRWNRHVVSLIARSRPADMLHAPASARLDLLPYQLEPAIAVALDGASRVLIADGVGLGKTIQAGLIVAELRLRRLADRVLVLTPAGLRHQWAREFRRRFRLPCTIMDAPALSALRATLPATVNPWSVPAVVVASIDFVKRPDVEPGAAEVPWDLLVLDEAHLAAIGTARRLVVQRLAGRTPHVVLLTATPHAGDDGAFEALCALGGGRPARARAGRALKRSHRGEGADPMVVFRRRRLDAGLTRTRRNHLRMVTPTPVERRMHDSLVALARAVWTERRGGEQAESRLAFTVLLKRALSGPASLARSIEHRLSVLAERPHTNATQLDLFDDDDDDPADRFTPSSVAAPGLCDTALEIEWLQRIARDARLAAEAPAKVAALLRTLTRIREPAIVFTEYRDTLLELAGRIGPVAPCVVVHGGLDQGARADALRLFARGRARVLVATDAAGVGLNLQVRCRLVINLELPWNPMRLEQRVGRVDRIGQTRTVHAVHLVARDTVESRVLARLVGRMARVRLALGNVEDPLGPAADIAVAHAFLTESGIERLWDHVARRDGRRMPARGGVRTAGTDVRADQECRRAAERRRLLACRALQPSMRREPPAVAQHCPVAWLQGRSLHRSWLARVTGRRSGMLLIFEAWLAEPGGQVIESFMAPVWVDCRIGLQDTRSGMLAAIARAVDERHADAQEAAGRAAWQRSRVLDVSLASATRRRRNRLAALTAAEAPGGRRLVQAGLFDHRALREARREPRQRTLHALPDPALSGRDERSTAVGTAGIHPAGTPTLVAVFALLTGRVRPCLPA
ncbi:MAG: helicase-related protein [Acidobacteriota bacterium]